ncbi:ABC transporter permease [Chitinibacter sp. SCUT-21]|uniref:ABC transporter permease n=1 Tax=Chitinibacter sp. SCUT-21 TaxID=2970891 RepID=UPI0035A62161
MIDKVLFLKRSFSIQCTVISALLMREVITRYGRNNLGFMWLFFEPMLFTAGISILWYFTRGAHGLSLPIIPFALTGYSTVLLWRNASTRCAKAIEPNISLLFHRNVTVLDLFITRVLLEIAGATIALIGLSVIFISLGLMKIPSDILTMIWGWLLFCWFAFSLGLIVGVMTEVSETFGRTWGLLTYLAFPLSGAFFMVEWLPHSAAQWMLLIPMVHGTEMLREGYFGPLVNAHYDASYFALINFVMLFIGLALLTRFKNSLGEE